MRAWAVPNGTSLDPAAKPLGADRRRRPLSPQSESVLSGRTIHEVRKVRRRIR